MGACIPPVLSRWKETLYLHTKAIGAFAFGILPFGVRIWGFFLVVSSLWFWGEFGVFVARRGLGGSGLFRKLFSPVTVSGIGVWRGLHFLNCEI